MESVLAAHPVWLWLALGGLLLISELATGSGWLLWPAGSAFVVGLLVAVVPMPPAAAVALFAALTILTTVIGRRFFRRPSKSADINDTDRLIGLNGVAASAFENGEGRAMVEGKEWQARLEAGLALTAGAPLIVTGRLGGAQLMVRAA